MPFPFFTRHVIHLEFIDCNQSNTSNDPAFVELTKEIKGILPGMVQNGVIIVANDCQVGQPITDAEATDMLAGVPNGPEFVRGYVPVG
jgi:hypothetical protein